MSERAEDIEVCPVCDKPIEVGQYCSLDYELGTCHAECLEGSPTVDLDTGEAAESGDGHFVKISFKTLDEMHDFHQALVSLSQFKQEA